MNELEPTSQPSQHEKWDRKIVYGIWGVLITTSLVSSLKWGWKAIGIGAMIAVSMILNGILAEWEDDQPGGFNNPKKKE
jgi:hypothetical protein